MKAIRPEESSTKRYLEFSTQVPATPLVNLLNSLAKTSVATVGTALLAMSGLDFKMENYALGPYRERVAQFLPDWKLPEELDNTCNVESNIYIAQAKDLISTNPEAALTGVLTLLTCIYMKGLSRHMPNWVTRGNASFALSAVTIYAIANYTFGCSITSEQLFNATVNSIGINLAAKFAAVPTQLFLRFLHNSLNSVRMDWPGAYFLPVKH